MRTKFMTIRIRVSQAVNNKIGALAKTEGKSASEMAGILLEDALALRVVARDAKARKSKGSPNREVPDLGEPH